MKKRLFLTFETASFLFNKKNIMPTVDSEPPDIIKVGNELEHTTGTIKNSLIKMYESKLPDSIITADIIGKESVSKEDYLEEMNLLYFNM